MKITEYMFGALVCTVTACGAFAIKDVAPVADTTVAVCKLIQHFSDAGVLESICATDEEIAAIANAVGAAASDGDKIRAIVALRMGRTTIDAGRDSSAFDAGAVSVWTSRKRVTGDAHE